MMISPHDWEREQLKLWRELSGLPQDFNFEFAIEQGSFCCPEADYNLCWAGSDEDLPETEELTDKAGTKLDSTGGVWKQNGYVFMLTV